MTIKRSDWRGVKRGSSAPKRSMSYGAIDSDMYSIAQQAVANGYGKSEYLRAQARAWSTRVQTTDSARIPASPRTSAILGSVVIGLAMARVLRLVRVVFNSAPSAGAAFIAPASHRR